MTSRGLMSLWWMQIFTLPTICSVSNPCPIDFNHASSSGELVPGTDWYPASGTSKSRELVPGTHPFRGVPVPVAGKYRIPPPLALGEVG